jgi:quercetin dioxygenase-like cupin family protein
MEAGIGVAAGNGMAANGMMTGNDSLVRIGDLELHFKVDESNPVADVTVFEFVVPRDARVPAPHHHVAVDEFIYGLAGTMTATVDGVKHEIRAGDSIFIPRGCVHHHANLHAETARVLSVLTPGSIGKRYFEEIAEVVNAGGKPDIEKVKAIMLRHGLVPA